MHYEFPEIETIHDVLPYVKLRDDFKIMEKDGLYIVIDYVYTEPDSFDYAIRHECRGIVFDKHGKLISRPFQKFFNLGERPETQPNKIDLSKSHKILVKEDGSMIRPVMVNNELVFMTRKGITDVAEQAWNECKPSKLFQAWMVDFLKRGFTPIFEYVSPNNKIVLDYEKPELILLGIRNNLTGQYLQDLNHSLITSLNFNDPVQLHYHTKHQTGIEGYVVRFEDGHMIKIKCDDYVNLHRTIDIFESEKNILKIILTGKSDDLYAALTEVKQKRLKEYENAVNHRVQATSEIVRRGVDIMKNRSQKDFAIWVNKNLQSKYRPLYFQFRKNAPENDVMIVRNYMLNHTSTMTKIEELRTQMKWQRWSETL